MAANVDETPEQRQKREKQEREKKAILLLFLLLVDDCTDSLTQQVTSYLSGSVSVHSLSRTFTATLFGAHAQSTYYGRRYAGVAQPMGDADTLFAQTVMQEQSGYITAFLNDLSRAQYPLDEDGDLPGDLTARLRMWARRLRGTANDAWRLSLDPDTLLWWVLDPTLKHCVTCPAYAASSPRRAADWDVQPGSADCECGSNCGCKFVDAAGNFGFPRDGRI